MYEEEGGGRRGGEDDSMKVNGPLVIFSRWARSIGVILALIVTATSIFNTYFHYQIYPVISRVEKLEAASTSFKEDLKGKVDNTTLKIYLSNLNKKLDELSTDIKWLIKRER